MTALRARLAGLWREHCRIAEAITPRRFALIWDGIAVASFVGSVLSPDPASGLALALIGIVAVVMAWMNATGRIHQ